MLMKEVYCMFFFPADQVYIPREIDRQEYVMNDVGTIYNGDANNFISRSWNFGQVSSNTVFFFPQGNKHMLSY